MSATTVISFRKSSYNQGDDDDVDDVGDVSVDESGVDFCDDRDDSSSSPNKRE